MTEYRLTPTGRAPVAFIGELITSVIGAAEYGPKDHARNHSVTIYRTRARTTWIVEIHYSTTWDHERDEITVHTVRARDEVSAAQRIACILANHHCCRPIVGYPTGPQFAEKQARLFARHEADWQALVSAVLGQLPASEEVIP